MKKIETELRLAEMESIERLKKEKLEVYQAKLAVERMRVTKRI